MRTLFYFTPPYLRVIIFVMLWFNAPGALLSAQEQTFYLEEWHATEGEQAESLDRLVSITDASSNLYVAGSQLNQYGKYDLLLTKYDNTGYELWSTTFNVTDTTGNVVVGDMALSSGYVIITGTVYNGASNNYDALTLKYNTSGVKQWHKTYNGAGSFYDGGTNIYTDFSNNIYIAGGTASLSNSMNMLCIKYNSSGTQQWAQSIDGYGRYDVAGYVYYRTASTVILVGAVQQSAASWAVGSLTLNTSTGSVATSLAISEETDLEEVTAMAVDENGKIYVAGYSSAGGNGKDFVTLKLSSTLTLNWEAVYDGSLHEDDAPRGIAVDGSGNVYVAGYTTTANGKDFTVIKYNSSGAQQWAKLVDGAAGQDDEARAITVDGDGNAVAAGYATENSSRDFYTTILDPSDGSTAWSATFNGLANKNDEASQVLVDSTGSIIVLGKGQTDHPEVTAYTTVRYAKRSLLLPHETEDASTAISFIENRGQLADTSGAEVTEVRFYNTSAYPATYYQDDKLSFVTASIDTSASTPDTLHRVDMTFKNGKNDARVFGLGKREAYHNYYLGHIPEGRARVGLYERAVQTDIYNKIDLEFYSNSAGVKYYFVIKPGGDPADIQLDFEGQSSLSVNGNEELAVGTSVGELKWSTYLGGTDDDEVVSTFGSRNIKLGSIAFQAGSNDILAIIGNSQSCASFSEHEPGGYFQLLNFSPIIARFENRILASSTCFNHGGGPYGIALGPGGNVYIAGATVFGPPQNSSDFCVETSGNLIPICPPPSGAFFQDDDVTDGAINNPQANGGEEIFISAFDGDGTLVYSTLFGGNNGEVVRDLKIEGDYLYMTGNTTSNEKFPLIDPGAPAFFDDEYSGPGVDAFIAQLNISNLPTFLKEQAINEKAFTFTYISLGLSLVKRPTVYWGAVESRQNTSNRIIGCSDSYLYPRRSRSCNKNKLG